MGNEQSQLPLLPGDNLRPIHIPFSKEPVRVAEMNEADLLHCIRELATMSNYLEPELRYIDRGDLGPKAPAGPEGTPGYR
jgi:hypothetical protein